MKKTRRKLITWISTMALLIVCITTSTYAWFQLNSEGWVGDFNFNFDTDEGILISVDGTNYSQGISNENLMRAMVKEAYGYTYDNYGNLLDKDLQTIKVEKLRDLFEEISLDAVTSKDGKKFRDYYNVDMDATSKKMYQFEIYIKLFASKSSDVVTPIYFIHDVNAMDTNTKIESEIVKYRYMNNFTSFDPTTFEIKHYSPAKVEDENGSLVYPTIEVSAKDALRFSTQTLVEENDELVEDVKVYELNQGLGSYATKLDSSITENKELAKYDATKNAGFTLLNASLTTPLVAMEYEDIPTKLYENFESEEAQILCNLYNSNDYTNKVKFSVWIEGYDADCFNGIGRSKINVSFGFSLDKGGVLS